MRTLHVGLRVEDLERSLAFYTTLAYDVVGTVPDTAFGSLTMLKLPDDEFVSVELVHQPAAGAVDPRGLNHLVVQVEDLHGVVTGLGAHAIHAEAPTSPDGSDDFWMAWSPIPTATASNWSSGLPATPTGSPAPTSPSRSHPKTRDQDGSTVARDVRSCRM